MRVMVLGAGALGSLIGGLLSRRYDVTLVGRKPHIDKIKENGLRITGMTELIAHPNAVYDIANSPPSDLVILTVKSYDTLSAITALKPHLQDTAVVLSLQNGLDNLDKICTIVGKERTIGGVTSLGVTFVEPGHIYHAGIGDTVIGEQSGSLTERVNAVWEMFNAVGIKTSITNDISREIWGKVIVNAGINPVTAVTRLPNGYLLRTKELERVLELLCTEGVHVANSCGIYFSEDLVEKTKTVARLTSENKSSMLQDIERKKRTEIDSINGAIVSEGKKRGIKTPVNEVFVSLIKCLERSYL